MSGLVGQIAFLAVLAGTAAFLIDYDESLHRFSKRRALRRSAVTGLTATVFFGVLGTVVVLALFR